MDKLSKAPSYKNKGANGGIYFCFNSEEGCQGKCYFLHVCSHCESKVHSKKDCIKYQVNTGLCFEIWAGGA